MSPFVRRVFRQLTRVGTGTTLALLAGLVAAPGAAQDVSFFLTSAGPGDGAALGGLAGADAHCARLASAAGLPRGDWRAYLSTVATDGNQSVNARDRIGAGPWRNARGVQVARDVAHLHSDQNNLTKQTVLTENGDEVNGRGDDPNRHDILTGSDLQGRAVAGQGDTTCGNWTSNGGDGSALVGHHDRTGGGDNPTSWNSAHGSRGCGQADLQGTGGDGLFYCFRADGGGVGGGTRVGGGAGLAGAGAGSGPLPPPPRTAMAPRRPVPGRLPRRMPRPGRGARRGGATGSIRFAET